MAISKLDLVLSFKGHCLLNLIAAVDSTVLAVSLPTIANSLGAMSTQAYWAGSSFVLASSAVQSIYAAFSNAFGRRTLTLIALALFTIGTIVGSTAKNVASLLVGRILQGAGGGGFLTMTYVVLVDFFTLRQRANAIAVIGLVWLVGTVVGPIAGGAFTEYVTWRWIFWICLPFAGVSIFLIAFFLKTPHEPLQLGQALKMVDWAGAVVFTGYLTSFLLAISWGGSIFPWSSYQTLRCLFTSQSMATQAASEPQHMTIAAGLSPFFRALGQTIGIVIGDSIFQNTLRSQRNASNSPVPRHEADEYSNNITRLGAILKGLPHGSQERADLLAALNPSFHAIWWTLTAFALASLALSLCIPQLSLDQSQPVMPSEDPENDVERTAESRGVNQEAEMIQERERANATV